MSLVHHRLIQLYVQKNLIPINRNEIFLNSYRIERTALFNTIVIIDIKMDAKNAAPNPSMVNPSKKLAVNIKTPALMTNKNSPKLKIVIGRVKMINSGFTRTFKIDKINPASNAV